MYPVYTLAQGELDRLAADADVGMLYSATFCGGLPVLNIVRRDMVCGNILGFRGIFNATTN
ncbi:MAG: homoserine dehydrogenase, partial [Rhodothermales bacterium]